MSIILGLSFAMIYYCKANYDFYLASTYSLSTISLLHLNAIFWYRGDLLHQHPFLLLVHCSRSPHGEDGTHWKAIF